MSEEEKPKRVHPDILAPGEKPPAPKFATPPYGADTPAPSHQGKLSISARRAEQMVSHVPVAPVRPLPPPEPIRSSPKPSQKSIPKPTVEREPKSVEQQLLDVPEIPLKTGRFSAVARYELDRMEEEFKIPFLKKAIEADSITGVARKYGFSRAEMTAFLAKIQEQ